MTGMRLELVLEEVVHELVERGHLAPPLATASGCLGQGAFGLT